MIMNNAVLPTITIDLVRLYFLCPMPGSANLILSIGTWSSDHKRCASWRNPLYLVSSPLWDYKTADFRGARCDNGGSDIFPHDKTDGHPPIPLILLQPGVSDTDTERLVNEKIEVFWRAIESGANKRGQVYVGRTLRCITASWQVIRLSLRLRKRSWKRIGFRQARKRFLGSDGMRLVEHLQNTGIKLIRGILLGSSMPNCDNLKQTKVTIFIYPDINASNVP